jgi:hypothetical protein
MRRLTISGRPRHPGLIYATIVVNRSPQSIFSWRAGMTMSWWMLVTLPGPCGGSVAPFTQPRVITAAVADNVA